LVKQWLNKWRNANPYNKNGSSIRDKNTQTEYYSVPLDYDHSYELGQQTLDHYILDEDILKLLKLIMREIPSAQSFQADHRELADCLFSQPYPMIAKSSLGY
jgi:hypothetical protein